MTKPTVIVDFDGVIHSYTSGWKGPRTIPDPVVPGAMEFLFKAVHNFEVAVVSSRSHYLFGRSAMRNYIKDEMRGYLTGLYELAREANYDKDNTYLDELITQTHVEITLVQINHELEEVMKCITFPKHKPPAVITIDDRALTFTGIWPTMEEIKKFKPWYK